MYVSRGRGKVTRFRDEGVRRLRTGNRVPLADGPCLSPTALSAGFSVCALGTLTSRWLCGRDQGSGIRDRGVRVQGSGKNPKRQCLSSRGEAPVRARSFSTFRLRGRIRRWRARRAVEAKRRGLTSWPCKPRSKIGEVGFSILDFGLRTRWPQIPNPKSAIQNQRNPGASVVQSPKAALSVRVRPPEFGSSPNAVQPSAIDTVPSCG